jgi:hypothetical protein
LQKTQRGNLALRAAVSAGPFRKTWPSKHPMRRACPRSLWPHGRSVLFGRRGHQRMAGAGRMGCRSDLSGRRKRRAGNENLSTKYCRFSSKRCGWNVLRPLTHPFLVGKLPSIIPVILTSDGGQSVRTVQFEIRSSLGRNRTFLRWTEFSGPTTPRAALPSPCFFGADPMHAKAIAPICSHRDDSMP